MRCKRAREMVDRLPSKVFAIAVAYDENRVSCSLPFLSSFTTLRSRDSLYLAPYVFRSHGGIACSIVFRHLAACDEQVTLEAMACFVLRSQLII